ncbi:hypothetical protein D9615_009546 [Tricholomella constricta]|uniref:Uncharacterized protein n=1 Tax=Tricholomella constricta TaxID=117010 RepID=A0A8H5GVK0_9AGAR|nr:hypothetical protein D9615_009546 [Tricholomella constricta]
MVAHVAPRHLHKRQVVDPLAPPTGVAGIENTATTVDATATATNLVFDTAAPSVTLSAPNLGITTTPVTTVKATPTATPESSTPTPSVASAASSPIPMSTVVGACVGALIGAVALILLGLWFYRRYSRSLKQHARSRRALGTARNIGGDQSRRRSHLEPWNKLEDGDDKWEGMYQAKEVDNVAPMEKLTMFKKTPSVRTAYTHRSDEPVTFDSHPFAQYHPNLAQELASNDKAPELPIARQFLGRVDTGPAISWDGETVGDSSYLSIRSNRLTSGAMSPTLNMAIPTPPATSSPLHRWESAEVLEYEDPDFNNPFGAGSERRKSSHNPFFNAHSISPSKSGTRSRSNSTRKADAQLSKVDKGKGRAADDDPFSDNFSSIPRPFVTSHTASGSLSSVSSNDRALQSLIAALDVSEEEVQERLRVASMQPSFISATSVYTSGGEEEDVTGSFPLPPSTDGGHRELH